MNEQNRFYVYVLFRPWNGEPFYVGKGTKNRFERTIKSIHNRHKTNIVAKSARLGLEIPCVKIADKLTEIAAFELERIFINAIGRKGKGPLVNLTDGGDGMSGYLPTLETRAKTRASLIGKKRPLEVGAKISATKLTQSKKISAQMRLAHIHRSPEVYAKIGDARRGWIPSDATRAKMSASQLGRKQSADHIEKRAAKLRGKKRSVEICTKIGAAHKGKTISLEARARMSAAASNMSPEKRARILAGRMKRSPEERRALATKASQAAKRAREAKRARITPPQ